MENAGPSDAQDVTVTDTLPGEVTFVDATAPYAPNPPDVVLDVGTLAAGATRELTVVVTVKSWVTETFTNSVVVGSTTPDGDLDNNDDDEPTGVVPLADLGISKDSTPDPHVPGEPLTYTLVVVNAGPSNAVNTVVSDSLDAATSYDSSSVEAGADVNGAPRLCVYDSGSHTVACDLGVVEADETVTITLVTTVDSGFTDQLFNTVLVDADTVDPDPDDDDATDQNPSAPRADVTVSKRDAGDPATPGEGELVYTLVYTNNGPSDADNVVVTDTLPDEVTFVDAQPEQDGGPNPLVWDVGPVVAGQGGSIAVTVTVKSWVTETFTNAVTIATDTPESDVDNNDDTEPTDVSPLADVTVTKTDDQDPVTPGEGQLVYTLVYTNNGPSDAVNVVVTDTLHDGVTFVAADPGQDDGPNPLAWDVGTIAAGESGAIAVTVAVDAWVTETFTNGVTIDTDTPESDLDNNDDDEPTDVSPLADLGVTKDSEPDPHVPGDPLTYTLTVVNQGPSDAQGVVVSDMLDDNTSYVESSVDPASDPTGKARVCSHDPASHELTCDLWTVAVAETVTVTLVTEVAPAFSGVLTNTASVSAATEDPNSDNDLAPHENPSLVPVGGVTQPLDRLGLLTSALHAVVLVGLVAVSTGLAWRKRRDWL